MRNMLKGKMIGWPEVKTLNADDYAIQNWIDKLDQLSIQYECKWGVDGLVNLVSPTLKEKWQRQIEKINDAIINSDIFVMPDLYAGTERGYKALEAEAMANGHRPHIAPLAWTVAMPCGAELAIVATRNDARALHGGLGPNANTVIWTLEEIGNFISRNGILVNKV